MAAPQAFVKAALAKEPRLDAWLKRAFDCAAECQSTYFITSLSAVRPWRSWMFASVANVYPADDPMMLRARLQMLLAGDDDEDPLLAAMSLADDTRRVLGKGVDLAEVLMVVHRRASEADAHDKALEAAREATALFAAADAPDKVSSARRCQAATLLRTEDFDAAFAILDDVLVRRGPLFGGGGAHFVGGRPLPPRAAALDEAATIASWADHQTPEWVRALGGIAQRFADPKLGDTARGVELWARFERSLTTMLQTSEYPGSDLEVVLRQAGQRKFRKVIIATKKIAKRLGVTPDE